MSIKHLKEPFVIIMVGPPLSGKTSWIKKNFADKEVVTICRDEIAMEVYGSDNYDEAIKHVNHKDVNRVLREKMMDTAKKGKNAIIDMTHMVSKRRRVNLQYFPNKYYKVAVVFPILDKSEYDRRNQLRRVDENKFISDNTMETMLKSFQPVKQHEEGFDKVIFL